MLSLEIDSKVVKVPEGSMLMYAADRLGIYIPHFCYHPKLSIAANCRMCLVDVENASKPLPACATPAANGMKVFTRSDKATQAQKAVMEFLLLNHPLDCPICDQGGECQLQDLAVGYGSSRSRYEEPKRVVVRKSIGPLISAEEMSRCIHCTRCVRFGQEIAGVMELGLAGRGEHSEIVSFLGRSVDSELSGNMIDLCPVGALTSKPFRYFARTWELSRRKTVAAHDSLCSNIEVQIKNDRILRVVPYENSEINSCWLSDRDRFSYEGINSPERLTVPMIKSDGIWKEVDWSHAINYAAHSISNAMSNSTSKELSLGALASGHSTLEELYLLAQFARSLGSDNIDFRIRQSDFSMDSARLGIPWLGMPLNNIENLKHLWIIGSFLRKDAPLISARVREAVKNGLKVSVLHAVSDDLLMPLENVVSIAPSQWPSILSMVLNKCLGKNVIDVNDNSYSSGNLLAAVDGIANLLTQESSSAILLGNAAVQHMQYAQLLEQVQKIAQKTGALFGVLGEAPNSVGGYFAGAFPKNKGHNAKSMVENPCSAYLLMNIEPTLDHAFPSVIKSALHQAKTVIALSSYRSDDLLETAHCLLPIAVFTETAGSFMNTEGRLQSFKEVVSPAGQAKPAWKVIRALADFLGLEGFSEFDTVESVLDCIIPSGSIVSQFLNNAIRIEDLPSLNHQTQYTNSTLGFGSLERLPEVPIYNVDPVVRRAISLQKTRDARYLPSVRVNSTMLKRFGWSPGTAVSVFQEESNQVYLNVQLDESVSDGVARLTASHANVSALHAITGNLFFQLLNPT